MKIIFVSHLGEKYTFANSWKEILDLKLEESISKEFYLQCKALETNTEFVEEIVKSRQNIGIPKDGLSVEEFLKLHTNKRLRDRITLRARVDKEVKRIMTLFKININCIEFLLTDIIISNYVGPTFGNLDLDLFHSIDDVHHPQRFTLNISKKISKNRLINYINDNWENISNYLSGLDKDKQISITEKEIKIINYRDKQKIKYSEITNLISKEYGADDPNSKINEDSIKTSYFRAKEKVSEIITKA